MNEIGLIQAWIIACLGGVLGVGFLYVRRVEPGPAVSLWAWAWLAFFVSLISSVWSTLPAELLSHATGTAFPALLLAGALAFTGRTVPRWLLPLGLAVGALRGLARGTGLPALADLGVLVVETPMDWVAALVLLRAARSDGRTPAVAALALLHATFGVLELANVRFLTRGGQPPFGYFALGCVATLVLALTQILALLERARVRHGRDLELLHEIAQSATLESGARDVVAHALEAIRQRLDLGGGAVWMLRDAGGLECIHYFGSSQAMPEDLLHTSAERPLPRASLQSGRAIYLDDILALPQLPVNSFYAEQGMRSGALVPIVRGGRPLGILVVGRKHVRPFDAAEQRILTVASQELFLALQHAESIERLAAERRTLASLVEISPTGILLSDREGRVEVLNATFKAHMGSRDGDDWVGRELVELAAGFAGHFEDPARIQRLFDAREGEAHPFTTPVSCACPSERELLIFGAPILSDGAEPLGRVWVTRDVSEERRLQEELRQSQKMETLGTLAGGIAHDFNNQLAAILGNAHVLLSKDELQGEAREALADIELAAGHCASLTRSLLAFARRAPVSMNPLEVGEVVGEAASLLRSLLPSSIDFEVAVEPDLPRVLADATQLQQMLINLVVNARDAVSSAGRIRLAARDCEIPAGRPDELVAGRYVEFSVSDDGIGMDEITRRRIFDPFFTTKEVSKGTGLGLAMVYGAMRAHRGAVEVESEPGRGSTFRLLIPAVSGADERAAPEPGRAMARGDETILLADDEPKLRRVVARVLGRQGYRVLEVEDGLAAVELFEERPDEIDLALLDVTMPGLDGPRALERMRALRPALPAVLMSGLLEIAQGGVDWQRTAGLQKPCDLDVLGATIRDLLDARHRPIV